jgi:hypothetical protein
MIKKISKLLLALLYFRMGEKSSRKVSDSPCCPLCFFGGCLKAIFNVLDECAGSPNIGAEQTTRRWKFPSLYSSFDTGYMTIEQVGYAFFGDNRTRLQLAKCGNNARHTGLINHPFEVDGCRVVLLVSFHREYLPHCRMPLMLVYTM